jgi:hypothetical protein
MDTGETTDDGGIDAFGASRPAPGCGEQETMMVVRIGRMALERLVVGRFCCG